MKKYYRIFIATLIMLILLTPLIGNAEEKKEEEKVTGELALGVMSAYVWRGQELTRDSVVIEPSLTVYYKGFTVAAWGNIDTKPYAAAGDNHAGKLTETDWTVSYTKKIGIVSLTPGYIYYALGAPYAGAVAPQDSQELFFSAAVGTVLLPTFTVYKEIDHYHQWYFQLGASHTFAVNKFIGLKLAGSVSYLLSTDESAYPKYDSDSVATSEKYNNFHEGTLSVSLPLAVYKTFNLTPTITYVFPLSNDAQNEMKGRGLQGVASPSDKAGNYLYGGLSLSFSF